MSSRYRKQLVNTDPKYPQRFLASLETLPNELLEAVVGLAGDDDGRHQHPQVIRNGVLGRIAQVSKRLNAISIPKLFKHFHQHKRTSAPDLLKAVLGRPDLGLLVKNFTCVVIAPDDQLSVNKFSPDNLARCRWVIESCTDNPSVRAGWFEALQMGEWDAITAVLLCMLPNLERFELKDRVSDTTGMDQALENPYMNSVFSRAATSQLQNDKSGLWLWQLKTVSLSYHGWCLGLVTAELISYLNIKSVSALYVSKVTSMVEESEPFSLKFETKHLSIHNSTINSPSFLTFLPCFISLETLYYHHGKDWIDDAQLLPQHIGRAIEHLKACLRVLILSNPGSPWCDQINDISPTNIGSLQGFKKLGGIRMSSRTLLGPYSNQSAQSQQEISINQRLVDCLPQSLVQLEIRECETGVLEQVIELLSRRLELVPNLQKVHLHYWLSEEIMDDDESSLAFYMGFDESLADALEDTCRAAGILLEIDLADELAPEEEQNSWGFESDEPEEDNINPFFAQYMKRY